MVSLNSLIRLRLFQRERLLQRGDGLKYHALWAGRLVLPDDIEDAERLLHGFAGLRWLCLVRLLFLDGIAERAAVGAFTRRHDASGVHALAQVLDVFQFICVPNRPAVVAGVSVSVGVAGVLGSHVLLLASNLSWQGPNTGQTIFGAVQARSAWSARI